MPYNLDSKNHSAEVVRTAAVLFAASAAAAWWTVRAWLSPSLREIGRGSSGIVYEGDWKGERVAIKVVRGRHNQDLLMRELNILRKLNHRNVVTVLGFEMFGHDARLYLEYASDRSLHDILYSSGTPFFSEEASKGYVRQILNGLEYLHGQDVLHRDIKPSNVLMFANGTVKLTDFGISRHQDSVHMAAIQGTPAYMAPEAVLRSGCKGSDIWAVGITLLEMLTGRVPVWGDLDAEGLSYWHYVAGNHLDGRHPGVPRHVSNDCRDFLSRCMAKKPEDRMTCSELLQHAWLQ